MPKPAAVPRRLTITIPGDRAEACQFTNGAIVGFWADPPQLYAWRDLDALREQWPDAELTWIDDAPPGERGTDGDSTHPAPSSGLGRPISELRDSGLLWLINRVVFHPRGLALALHADSTGQLTGWSLLGDGAEAWSFPEEVDQAHFRNAEATLLAARTGGGPVAEPREPNAYEEPDHG